MTDFMELVDDDSWDDRWDDDTGDGRLRHLVFLDGVLVDTFVRSARGSEYSCVALEMEAQRRPREPDPPPKPSWEWELERLDPQVGGRTALLALDAAPLEPRSLPPECVEAAGQLDALDLGEEFTIAVRNALVQAHECSASLVTGPPEQVAAAMAWIVARANAMTGTGKLRQTDLNRAFGLKSFPSPLASQLTHELQRFTTEPRGRLWGGHARHELGRPDLLLSHVRARLIRERDRALAARERAQRDAEARGA